MMTNVKKISIAMMLVAGFASTSAFAQDSDFGYDSPWYVSPNLLALHPDHDLGVEKNGPGAAIRLGKPMSPNWDFQMGAAFARVEDNGLTYRQAMADFNGLYFFSRNKFRPFLIFGGGLGYEKQKSDVLDNGEEGPFLDAGLGFQYAFNDRMALQFDYRRLHTFERTLNPAISQNDYLNLGLNIVVGGHKPAPVARINTPPVAEAPPPPAPRFEKFTLSAKELFPFDSATLSTGSTAPANGESSGTTTPKLDQIAEVLRNHPEVTNVAINGYADRLGSQKYNLELSQKRADAVKDYLTSKGIDANRMVASGKGEANPIVECDNKSRVELIDCLAPNRRVEVEDITVEHRVQ